MKRLLLLAVGIFVIGSLSVQCLADELKTDKEKLSYSIGMDIGKSFKQQSIDLDIDLMAQAIKDILAGSKTKLTEDEAQTALNNFRQEKMAQMQKERDESAQKNKTEGDAFLAENKTKPDVKTTASGLQYKVLQEGKGEKPKATDTVKTNYKGTLINGTEFDSSYTRGEPATFRVDEVIPGWKEALQLMPVGSKWQLFVPATLGYGESGAGQVIGPNATLIFEIELLEIVPPNPQ